VGLLRLQNMPLRQNSARMREFKIHVLAAGTQYRSRSGEYRFGTFVVEKGRAWNGESWSELGPLPVLGATGFFSPREMAGKVAFVSGLE
jgi:hypothetical protein